MGLSEERGHTDERALCHCPSVISLLYTEVDAEHEDISLFSHLNLHAGSAGETVIPSHSPASGLMIGRPRHNSAWFYPSLSMNSGQPVMNVLLALQVSAQHFTRDRDSLMVIF